MIAPIENGKPVETTSQTSLKESEKKKSNSTVDKDQFLQLLVAQMKYQDPLEPTSNTEYISQYATFSELEQHERISGIGESIQPGRADRTDKSYGFRRKDDDRTGQCRLCLL